MLAMPAVAGHTWNNYHWARTGTQVTRRSATI
jgi:hypothetical protein